MKRRVFIKKTLLANGALLLSNYTWATDFGEARDMSWNPNSYLKIDNKNVVTFVCSQAEIGQGTPESLAMILADAMELEIEELVTLKPKKDYQYIGQPLPAKKNIRVVEGSNKYGIDHKLEGMLYANFTRCPYLGGALISYDSSTAKKIKGVIDVFPIDLNKKGLSGLRAGLVVVANSTWTCIKAKKLLEIKWSEPELVKRSEEDVYKEIADFRTALGAPNSELNGAIMHFEKRDSTYSAAYQNPYQAHAFMEPLNALVNYKPDSIEVWSGHQGPQYAQAALATMSDLAVEKITVHNLPSGGGFGRRYTDEAIFAAAGQRIPKLPLEMA
jgi:isoquinoline 1-oxidoreductase beta subunit